jgi:DNA polymerase III gamma/tau subunit
MTVIAEKKQKIHQILDEMPEPFLDILLKYLEDLQKEDEEKLMQDFEQILEEDHQLLKRLAQ